MSRFCIFYRQALFILVIVLLIFVPLYPKFPLINVKGTFVAIRVEDLVIAVSLFFWGMYLLISHGVSAFFKDKLNQAVLLFFFVGLVSLVSGVLLTGTVVFSLGALHYLRRIELMLLMPLAYSAVYKKVQLKTILVILSGVLLLVNFYALGQRYLNWPVISTTNSEFAKGLILYLTPGARVSSTFAGYYDLAIFLAMALCLITVLFFLSRKASYLIWLAALFILSFYILILTAARVSFVAVAVGIVSSLLWLKKTKLIFIFGLLLVASLIYPSDLRNRFISTIVVDLENGGQRYLLNTDTSGKTNLNIPTLPIKTSSFSATATSSASSSGIASDIAPGEPLDSTELGVYRSSAIRFNYEWPRAIRAFLKNPLLGTGYSSIGIAADNDFLRSLAEVGSLGTISFGLVIWCILKRLKRGYSNSSKLTKLYCMGAFALVLVLLVNGTFIDVFESSKVATIFWLMMGVGVAFARTEV